MVDGMHMHIIIMLTIFLLLSIHSVKIDKSIDVGHY